MVKFPGQEKEWNKERRENLAEDLDILLADLCAIWGFCSGLTGWELTRDGTVITADRFAQAVVEAEGMTPSEGINSDEMDAWLPKIRAAFAARYGEAVTPQ